MKADLNLLNPQIMSGVKQVPLLVVYTQTCYCVKCNIENQFRVCVFSPSEGAFGGLHQAVERSRETLQK